MSLALRFETWFLKILRIKSQILCLKDWGASGCQPFDWYCTLYFVVSKMYFSLEAEA